MKNVHQYFRLVGRIAGFNQRSFSKTSSWCRLSFNLLPRQKILIFSAHQAISQTPPKNNSMMSTCPPPATSEFESSSPFSLDDFHILHSISTPSPPSSSYQPGSLEKILEEFSHQAIEERHDVLYPYIVAKRWGLSPEDNLLRDVCIALEAQGWKIYDREYFLDPDLHQNGKGDLIFAKWDPRDGLCLLVVELKFVSGVGVNKDGKRRKKRGLESQVTTYTSWWNRKYGHFALVAGVGLTEGNPAVEHPHCICNEAVYNKFFSVSPLLKTS